MKGSVLRGLDLTVKSEADRDKALAILRSVGQGDEPLNAASLEAVPVFLAFLRRLPLVPVELVPDLIGASFELARKINEANPTLLAKKHSRETIAALSQVFLFMPSGSKWVVCDMLAQLVVGCGADAADELLAMLLDAGKTEEPSCHCLTSSLKNWCCLLWNAFGRSSRRETHSRQFPSLR